MKHRTISTVLGMVVLTICLLAQSAWADNFEIVIKYGGKIVKMSNGTGIHDVFVGQIVPSGQRVQLAIPNGDETKTAYAPNQKIEGMITGFQAGDLVDVVVVPSKAPSGAPLLQTAKIYTMQPGETDPHAFIFVEEFDHKKGEQMISAITLSKFQQKTICMIPTHRDGDDLVADDVIKGIALHLQPLELVYAVTVGRGNGQTVKLLAPWKNHFTGKFSQLDPAAVVDTNNDTGPAVEITGPDGKLVTALIPGSMVGKKWMPDQSILGPARGLKKDADVDYITADSGDNRIWLVSIARAKPAAAAHAGIVRNGN